MKAEHKSEFEFPKRHPIFRHYGRAMVFICGDFGENWSRYNGMAL